MLAGMFVTNPEHNKVTSEFIITKRKIIFHVYKNLLLLELKCLGWIQFTGVEIFGCGVAENVFHQQHLCFVVDNLLIFAVSPSGLVRIPFLAPPDIASS